MGFFLSTEWSDVRAICARIGCLDFDSFVWCGGDVLHDGGDGGEPIPMARVVHSGQPTLRRDFTGPDGPWISAWLCARVSDICDCVARCLSVACSSWRDGPLRRDQADVRGCSAVASEENDGAYLHISVGVL